MMPEPIEKRAEQYVTRLLERRLQRAGLGLPGETNFLVQAQAPRPYFGGIEVRVRTWRHWSDAAVSFDAATGEIMERRIDRYAMPPCREEMTLQDAQAAVRAVVPVPPEAQLESFSHVLYAPFCTVARVQWRHVHQGLSVLGDFLIAMVHPKTRQIVEVRCKWRTVKLSGW